MLPEDADAQRRRKKKKKKKKKKTEQVDKSSIDWRQKLWYGAGGTLNFGGNNAASEFAIGITPMVGYKINNWFSVGPRFEATVNTGRYDLGFVEITKLNTFDYGVGAFTRAKSPFGIYGHLEYFLRNEEFPLNQDGNRLVGNQFPKIDANDNIETGREFDAAAYIGIGYNSAGFSKWGYEIQLNYDLLAPEDIVQLPIDLRVGLTYNF